MPSLTSNGKYRPYYILLVRDEPDYKWSIEFGDHVRSLVLGERDDYHFGYRRIPLKHLHIVKCEDARKETVERTVAEWIREQNEKEEPLNE